MILFDGVDIRSVADVKIEDIRVSAIEWKPVVRPRAISAGSQFVRNRAGTRTVTVTFALLQSQKDARQAAIKAICAWAKSDSEYRIDIVAHPDHYLVGVCTEKPSPSMRQWWESKLRIVFTCIDNPFWTDVNEKSVTCGQSFTVLGDAPPLMRIVKRRTVAASNQTYTIDESSITFSTIPAGDMIINLNDQTARSGNTNIMPYYAFTGRFPVPSVGFHTSAGDGIIRYRERWQ